MRFDSRVQKIWLRLLRGVESSPTPRIERIEEGYYAAVREAIKPGEAAASADPDDCRAVKPFIPNLSRTRAVYLNQQGAYGLTEKTDLGDWAGELGRQIERGACRAFAIVDMDIFAEKVSSLLRASGWSVESARDCLRVTDGQFRENINLLRAMVQMVFARSAMAGAARSLKAELGKRFLLDARLFARFQERFARFRPAVFDHYFTVCPDCSRLAAGWDYWQLSRRDARPPAEVFEQAMREFESLLATPQQDWLPAMATACCERNAPRLEVTHVC